MGMGAWIHHLRTSLWNSHLTGCHVTNKARSRVWGRLRNDGHIFCFSNFFAPSWYLNYLPMYFFSFWLFTMSLFSARSLRLIAELDTRTACILPRERTLEVNDRMKIWETEQSLCFVTTHGHPGIIVLASWYYIKPWCQGSIVTSL